MLAASALTAALLMGLLVLRTRRDRHRALAERAREVDTLRRRLDGVLAAGRDGAVLTSPSGVVVELNDVAAQILDVAPAQVVGVHVDRLPVRWTGEDGRLVAPAAVFTPRAVAGGTDDVPPFIVGAVPASGAPVRWVVVSSRQVPAVGGGYELLTSLGDVTGPREIRAALARSEQQFRIAMENAPIGVALVDEQWRLEQVNPAFAALFATDPARLVGQDLSTLSHPQDRMVERAQVQRLLAGEADRFTLEKRYQRVDGQTVWVVLDAVVVRTPEGTPDHFVAQVRDITESRMHAEMLAHRAMHDPLTGLANRAKLQEVLQEAVEQPGALGRVAVLVIDLDEFKQINDRYGHAAGDDVLVHVAGVMRAATAGRGTPARLGGDEFVIVVTDPDAPRVAFEVAAGIHAGLRNPVRTQRRSLQVRASVGIAIAEEATLTAGAMGLLAAADAAVYRAKGAGRGRTEVYDASMALTGKSTHGAAAEIAHAVESGQLVLHFQPTVDLASGAVVGLEALVRWQHPERGLLLPGAFLPTAEETGLGPAVGAAVLAQAVAFLARPDQADRWVSVNVSPDQLVDGALADLVRAETARHGVDPRRLVVELAESSVADAGARLRGELEELREIGVAVLLDDFGTGVSPLAYLRDLPVDGVKLDMSFTSGIPEDPSAARVSRALGALARELELTTIAEGVERPEQAAYLRSSGWAYGQGWLFGAGQSVPVAAPEA